MNDLFDGTLSLSEMIEKSLHRTPMQRLEDMFGVETMPDGSVEYGLESVSPATKKSLNILLGAAEKDPVLALMLLAPVRELNGYEYLMPDGLHLSYPIGKNGRVITEIDLNLGMIMEHAITNSNFESLFIIDDKSKKMVGFIAYLIDKKDKQIVQNIKLFKFDRNATTGSDAPILINDLLKKQFKEIRWKAFVKNPAAVKGYDLYIKRKDREGFETSRQEKDGVVFYSVTSRKVN